MMRNALEPRYSALDDSFERLTRSMRGLYARRAAASFVILALASMLCLALIGGRSMMTGTRGYFFLIWNLFLAWIPFVVALGLYHYRGSSRVLLLLGGACWLLFLPNAPYIITDLMHLRGEAPAPLWFDTLMIAAFAWTGLSLGLISLRMMQSLVRQRFGKVVSWAFALVVLALSSFGVYLGRFQRWNSWDLLTNPLGLGHDILHRISHPLAHPRTYVVTILFTAFLTLAYIMTSALPMARPGSSGRNI